MNPRFQRGIKSLFSSVFPDVPDFYGLLLDQCAVVVQGLTLLARYMDGAEPEGAAGMLDAGRRGLACKEANLSALHKAFSTPMDREDIYNAVTALDLVLNYACTTVQEMEALGLSPDEHTRAMARLLLKGVSAIQSGVSLLQKDPVAADAQASVARQTERETEERYRRALSELFDPRHYAETLTREQAAAAESMQVLVPGRDAGQAVIPAVGFLLEILKRREIYCHLSNTADRVADAAQVLHDIVAKVA